MEMNQLSVLSEKVTKALSMIQALKRENADLQVSKTQLQDKVSELEAYSQSQVEKIQALESQLGEGQEKFSSASTQLDSILSELNSLELELNLDSNTTAPVSVTTPVELEQNSLF
jgi:chromosome segregation ATPase